LPDLRPDLDPDLHPDRLKTVGGCDDHSVRPNTDLNMPPKAIDLPLEESAMFSLQRRPIKPTKYQMYSNSWGINYTQRLHRSTLTLKNLHEVMNI